MSKLVDIMDVPIVVGSELAIAGSRTSSLYRCRVESIEPFMRDEWVYNRELRKGEMQAVQKHKVVLKLASNGRLMTVEGGHFYGSTVVVGAS